MSYRRNVYILGAGFSAFAQAPLVRNFLATAKRLLQDPHSGLAEIAIERFDRVFHYRGNLKTSQAWVALDTDNLEELFGIVETETQFGDNALPIRDDLLFLIAKTLRMTIRNPQREDLEAIVAPHMSRGSDCTMLRDHQTVYDFFAKVVCTRREPRQSERDGTIENSIITLNYDTILENSLTSFGVKPDYYLPGVDDLRQSKNLNPRIRFLKLHGSIGWQVCKSKHILIVDDNEHFTGLSCPHCGDRTRPLLVPPTWNKSIAPPLNHVWAEAVECLRSAERIVMIGYSFPSSDKHVAYLLTLGLAKNTILDDFLCCDLDPQVFERLKTAFTANFHRILRPTSIGQFEFLVRSRGLQQTIEHAFPGTVPRSYDEYVEQVRR